MAMTVPDSEPDGDAELLARLGTDPDALEAFYRRHVSDVAAFVARRLYDADAVADVVSNTFLAVIRGSGSFDPDRSPDTARFWVLGIARREVANHHSSDGRRRELARRSRSAPALTDDETARIDELIDAQRLAPEIEAGVSRLSPSVRDAFLLVAVDGFSQRDAAAVLGISPAALRARLTRARLSLRRHLKQGTTDAPTPIELANAQLPGGNDGL